jgi:hypothetical protein
MTEEQMRVMNWKVMQDLEDAFNNVVTIDFIAKQLQEAVDSNDTRRIADVSKALSSFLPLYTKNWDDKFLKAWEVVVKPDTK